MTKGINPPYEVGLVFRITVFSTTRSRKYLRSGLRQKVVSVIVCDRVGRYARGRSTPNRFIVQCPSKYEAAEYDPKAASAHAAAKKAADSGAGRDPCS